MEGDHGGEGEIKNVVDDDRQERKRKKRDKKDKKRSSEKKEKKKHNKHKHRHRDRRGGSSSSSPIPGRGDDEDEEARKKRQRKHSLSSSSAAAAAAAVTTTTTKDHKPQRPPAVAAVPKPSPRMEAWLKEASLFSVLAQQAASESLPSQSEALSGSGTLLPPPAPPPEPEKPLTAPSKKTDVASEGALSQKAAAAHSPVGNEKGKERQC